MSKIRVYELAREIGMTNTAFVDFLTRIGIFVGSHMSSLDEDIAAHLKDFFLKFRRAEVDIGCTKPTIIRRRRKIPIGYSGSDNSKIDVGQIEQIDINLTKDVSLSVPSVALSNDNTMLSIQDIEGKSDRIELRSLESTVDSRNDYSNFLPKDNDLENVAYANPVTSSLKSQGLIKGKTFVIDALNICMSFSRKKKDTSISWLLSLIVEIHQQGGHFVAVFDRSAKYRFKDISTDELGCYNYLI